MTNLPVKNKSSLAFWMQRVLAESEKAKVALAPDPVHDLRVALRRCLSIADGVRTIDPDPDWKEMKKAGKSLFRKLGELRDGHVMRDWIHRLGNPGDPAAGGMLKFLAARETRQQREALQALAEFDRKQWKGWSRSLPRRMLRLQRGNVVFRHVALEAWTQASRLHRQAVRSPSQAGFHRLRIGLKRFRYIVENFLPVQHRAWSDDFKLVQDLLGDIHDLDVLWNVATSQNVFSDVASRTGWQQRIEQARATRIATYMEKMSDERAPWQIWREALPRGREIEAAATLRLKIWASFLDPDFKHSLHVSRLALQFYDGLPSTGKAAGNGGRNRTVLGVAAMVHGVGKSKARKGSHKRSYRMIKRLVTPLGWRRQDLIMVGIVARYYRGALPAARHEALRGLSLSQRKEVTRLAAILRLAEAFDAPHDGHIRRLKVTIQDGLLLIAAQGYSPRDHDAETVAGARHLLETVHRCPVMVKAMIMKRRRV